VTATRELDAIDAAPLPFDRRLADRIPVGGDYVAVVIDGDDAHIATVEYVDQSSSGIGIRSPIPMRAGAICHLHPHAVIALADVGRVVRCTPVGDHYSIGLATLSRKAA